MKRWRRRIGMYMPDFDTVWAFLKIGFYLSWDLIKVVLLYFFLQYAVVNPLEKRIEHLDQKIQILIKRG